MVWHRRHSILTILFGAYFLCYMDRMAIASAIPVIAQEFQLSPLAMGSVMSAFFIGYAFMQLPGGLLADRFGPRRVMVTSVALWSVFTALTGAANSLTSMLGIRVLFGLSEGPFPPSASKTVTLWFPRDQVGRANGLQMAAVQIGAAVAPLIVTTIIVHFGWRAVFYSLLLPGLLLALLIWIVVRDSPPLAENGSQAVTVETLPVMEVLKMPVVFWSAVTIFFWAIAGWGLLNWLPTYLLQARGFSLPKMGLLGSLPYLAGALGYFLGGYLSDKHFSHARYIPILVGLILGGITTYLAAIAPTGELAIVALIFAFLFLFIASSGIFTMPLVAVPQQAVGTAFGLVNTFGQIAAFLSPLAVGAVLNASHSNFTLVFYGFVGLFAVAACTSLKIRSPAAQAYTSPA